MRIGLVTGEYPPMQGGVGDFTREMALALGDLGCQVRVVTDRTEEDAGAGAINSPYDLQRVISPDWGWRDMLQVQKATGNLDLVNIQYQAAAYGKMRPPLHFLPMVLETPSVVTFHDLRAPYLFPKAGLMRRHAIMVLARGADGVIVTNSEDHQTLFNAGKIRHLAEIPIGSNIPYSAQAGLDPALWRAAHGVREDEFLLGYFGSLNSSKGGESLIQAMAGLAQDFVPIRLALIGGQSGTSDPTNAEDYERISALAHSMGVSGSIIRTGFLPPTEISTALLSCHVMVMPYRDGASLRRGTLMACLNHGCPTITTQPNTTLPDLQHGKNIYLVSPNSPQAIMAAVSELRDDPHLRARIGRAAQVLSDIFTWDKIAVRTLEFFEGVVASR